MSFLLFFIACFIFLLKCLQEFKNSLRQVLQHDLSVFLLSKYYRLVVIHAISAMLI